MRSYNLLHIHKQTVRIKHSNYSPKSQPSHGIPQKAFVNHSCAPIVSYAINVWTIRLDSEILFVSFANVLAPPWLVRFVDRVILSILFTIPSQFHMAQFPQNIHILHSYLDCIIFLHLFDCNYSLTFWLFPQDPGNCYIILSNSWGDIRTCR